MNDIVATAPVKINYAIGIIREIFRQRYTQRMRRTRTVAPHGLAIGVILLALCLIVALAVAIGVSMRARGNKGSASEDYANATRILSEGENYKRTFDLMLANGMDVTVIKFNGTSIYSMKNPANGLSQFKPPSDAVQVSSNNWNYRGATVFMEGSGTDAGAEYILFYE